MKYDNIPEEVRQIPRWVCAWNNSKIPMQATIRKGASSTNPETWSTFEDAETAVNCGIYDHIGFVFNDDGIIGIDIDAGFDEDGFLSPLSIDIMRACFSYTEKSRSGRGVHILIKGSLPFSGKNNGAGVEIYKSRRYFIMTGDKLIYDTIIENQAAIDYVVSKYFPKVEKEGDSSPVSQRIYSPVHAEPTEGKISLRPTYPPIPNGMRNNSLTSLAGQLHNNGYSVTEIFNELMYANRQACNPPLPHGELETIVNSVTKYRR